MPHLATAGILASKRSGFSPDSITNMELWLDAGEGVYSDAGTTLAGDNDSVYQWNDQSGNGNHAVQTSSSQRPVYKTSIVNGEPVIRYDNTVRFLESPNSAISNLSTDFSMFIVQKMNAVQSRYNYAAVSDDTSNRMSVHLPWNSSTAYLDYGDISGNGRISAAWGGNTTDFFLFSGQVGSGMALRRNGTEIASSGTSSTFTPGSKTLRIGSEGTNALNGDFAELLMYSRRLSSTEIGNVESYLADKYGIII